MTTLREQLEGIKSLPALPSTVVRLIRGLGGQGLSAEELESIVKTDEAISAVVLRMANSAQQGQTERPFTLHESVARLGSRVLQKIAISQQCRAALSKGDSGHGLSRAQAWVGALGGALAAEEIARQTEISDPSVVFVGALLRDIGKMAMDELIGVDALRRAFSGASEGETEVGVERGQFALDHAEVGGELAGLWGLPTEIQRSIQFHHAPDSAEEADRPTCDVVHCADAVATWMGLGVGHKELICPISARARDAVGMDAEAAEVYMVATKDALDKLMGGG